MLDRKLLLRRWACVPWLLAVGLVLGWNGEVVADAPETDGTEANHSGVADHTHATDPYLDVSYKLDMRTQGPDSGLRDSVFVSWSTSYGKNFHKNVDLSDALPRRGNRALARDYIVSLFKGEIPEDPSASVATDDALNAAPITGSTLGGAVDVFNFTSAAGTSGVRRDTLILNLEAPGDPASPNVKADTGPGFYWVRIQVVVLDGDETGANDIQTETFAKQIAVKPTYTLSVSPTTVREDADPTNIAVKVRVCDTCPAVGENTPVALQLATNQTGKDRFSIDAYPTLTIPKGQKEATGTIRFTPDESSTTPDDDLLVTLRTDTEEVDGSADIRLVDSDKESNYVNLSFSTAELNKRDPETAIEVTATLDGKPLSENLSFVLTIDKDYETANSIAAKRDSHYTARMATITIRRNRISGRATININPINIEKETRTRPFRVIASNSNSQVTVDGRPITVNGALIDITGDPGRAVTGLRATPFSIREDAVTKEVTLEVTLRNALATDERVQFSFEDGIIDAELRARLSEDFDDADPAERDTHYDVRVQPLTIPRGDTKGTTTMTVTVSNDTDTNDSRAFTVTATVGGVPYSTGILITDDDAASGLISLEVSPAEISEDAGPTTVTVTATLHGKEFDDDIVVPLVIDADPKDPNEVGELTVDVVEATRDHDFHASLNSLTIPAGSIQGTTTITITPTANDGKEEDEKIRLKSLAGLEAEDEDGIAVPLTINSVDITLKDTADAADDGDDPSQPAPADPTRPSFAADAAIADQVYTVGTAIDPLELPEAVGDDTPFLYNVFSLGMPTGLSFDAATRTLSGTPTAATDGAVSIIYTVVDSDGDAGIPLTFSITVNAAEVAPPTADAEIMATPSLIREDAGQTQVSLTVSLAEAKDADERVTFTIVAPSQGTEGKPAVRDVDYDATLGAVVTIPSGETVGTSTLTLTPRDNSRVDGLRAIGVQATFSSGATLLTDIEISDDETSSTSIALSVSPHSVSEDAGTTDVSVTATLDGQALAADATVSLSISNASTAMRDVDYSVEFTPLIQIPAGSTIGVTLLTLRPIDDDIVEGDEIIKLTGTIAGLVGDEAELLLSDSDQAMVPDEPDEPETPGDGSLAFSGEIDSQTYTAGTAIDPLVLPGASGGTGDLTYSLVGTLPAGLSFDAATRTLSGTPTAATDGAVSVTYIVVDESGTAAVLIFSITVNAGLSMSFGFADNTVVPDQSYTAGTTIAPLVLPAASGGTGALTYRLVGLPAGLSFDSATRTLSGTPTAATNGAVEVSYIVTDEGESIDFLTFNITVNQPLSFGDLFGAKIVPDSHGLTEIREFVVGQRVEGLTLPAGTGGTAPLTYSLSPALPAGLTFDAATRTIAGTPRAASEAVYTYTVADANGATATLSLQTLPAAFSLADNFPNPFNPATTIQYALPEAADVELTVYNVLGQPVRTLIAEHQSAGRYMVEWDATNDSGHSLSSGMYFYRLQAGGEFHEVKKMLLLK